MPRTTPMAEELARAEAEGAIALAAHRLPLRRELGEVTELTVNGVNPPAVLTEPEPDAPVSLRVSRKRAEPLDLAGRRVAEIANKGWFWATEDARDPRWAGSGFLSGPQRITDGHVAAATSMAGGKPVWLVPRQDGTAMAVAVDVPKEILAATPRATNRMLIAEGLSSLGLPAQRLARRAVESWASELGIPLTEPEPGWLRLGDGRGTRVEFSPEGFALRAIDDSAESHSPDGMLADAAYLAAEHQLLLDGTLPRAHAELDLKNNTVEIASRDAGRAVAARAIVAATYTGSRWTWGWADENLPDRAREASERARRFGRRHGIVPLLTPALPRRLAEELRLGEAIRPVLRSWTRLDVEVAEGVTAVVLADAPELHLPAPSRPAASAALRRAQRWLPERVDRGRAAAAYAAARGLAASQLKGLDGAEF
ncbi:DUF6882 domain-containing protein [Corynebacterium otitidis]|uniref:Uncharacterized protein n=1 Tax=Corynebacterium otitidis ATCC 51513 TaxID=883169 RepID=I7JVI6_9CORY|nr:DUF6882 domain-containing protein [Corynebacterium otitidis]EJZ82669.1 hypothetical protein HMPREF9719_00400 [Corynebacterium otitidis ATCC 51513]CCI82901.1 hypothetical protein BN46_0150 [Corynebacterium otitidis ATCC 51513]